ncbi:hypothetical protein BSKO_06989 [Bryopsis sp. KO-2023]|nr:hypothetical protein BSKO_06989 [Bryopsis sp. KO-2023]
MAASVAFSTRVFFAPTKPRVANSGRFRNRRIAFQRTQASPQPQQPVATDDVGKDWAAQYGPNLVQLPLWMGGFGFVTVLANRLLSQVAPVIDAGSGLSRSDVLCVVCSAVLVLTGLNWLQLVPKTPPEVVLNGEAAEDWSSDLPENALKELKWAWRALSSSTRCQSLVVFHQGEPVYQAGLRYRGTTMNAAKMGKICSQTQESGRANYLANLQLFPGGVEFLGFLPPNTQGVVVVPMGDDGVIVAGTNVQRGVGNLDRAWLAALGEKLGSTLDA